MALGMIQTIIGLFQSFLSYPSYWRSMFVSFLISHYALHSTQSGLRPNHSCETALLQTINKFHEAINNGQIIGMVMVDFRKAFDLVDHTLLLKNSGIIKSQMKHFSGFPLIC